MKNRNRALRAAAPLTLAALLLSSCAFAGGAEPLEAGAEQGVDIEAKTIEIGSFVPETGPVPSYKLIAEGSKAYFDWLNANGGLDGWTINYTQIDDGYDPARSLAATKELVQKNQIFALVAPIGTPTNSAVQPFAVAESLPVVGAVGGDPSMAEQENYFVLLPNYYDEAKLDTIFGVEELGATKVAVLYENDDLGKPALQGVKDAVEELGVELVAEEAFNVSDTDLTAQMTKAKEGGAELTVVWGSNSNIATAVTTAERLGFETQMFAPFYTADPTTYALAGDALDGTMFGSWLLPTTDDNASVQAYVEQMTADGNADEIGVFSLNGWTNAALFAAGLEKSLETSDSPTRAGLLEALSGFEEVSVGGAPAVTFSPGNHAGTRSLSIIQAGDGAFATITDETIPFSW
ncbi:ABC transporter substrate-binding protein [Microbacterium sp. A84]|uniref:ABC transporter substrate-binding protein n=1 Tax=Microbacterium sp. A84 TaxID=3450715 RepID=UPI003F442609